MRNFILGIVFVIVVGGIVAFCVGKFGLVDIRADQTPSKFERSFAMGSMDASVERHAAEVKNPLQPTEATLREGMHLYEMNCAICHGDGHTPKTQLHLYPPAPQFMEDPADMPENQNFYIIQHGVRLTGMPGWSSIINEQDTWKLVSFLSHMDKLPPDIQKDWNPSGNQPAKEKGDMEHDEH